MIETVGKYLKEVRESKGMTLEEIADETKIQKRYLTDIENDNFDELPGEAYVKGFLRNYAAALKIDSEEVITLYKKMQLKSEESVNVYEEAPVVIEKASVVLHFLLININYSLFFFLKYYPKCLSNYLIFFLHLSDILQNMTRYLRNFLNQFYNVYHFLKIQSNYIFYTALKG